jgi:hypothetical protein
VGSNPTPSASCSPLFAFVRNPQQSQCFAPERCTYLFSGVLPNQSKDGIKRDAARQEVRAGVDIVQAKRAARLEQKATETAVELPTFEQCAQQYIDENWSKWSKKHRNQWPSSLKTYAYPTIGSLTIPEIKPSHIFDLLSPIWIKKRETANRVRGRIETIIAKNVDINDPDFRNPAELTKQLREKLPKRSTGDGRQYIGRQQRRFRRPVHAEDQGAPRAGICERQGPRSDFRRDRGRSAREVAGTGAMRRRRRSHRKRNRQRIAGSRKTDEAVDDIHPGRRRANAGARTSRRKLTCEM